MRVLDLFNETNRLTIQGEAIRSDGFRLGLFDTCPRVETVHRAAPV